MRAASNKLWMGKHAFPQSYTNSTECTQGTLSHVPPLVRDFILKKQEVRPLVHLGQLLDG